MQIGQLLRSSSREWRSFMTAAEKLVGYSASSTSLRCLLPDDSANLAFAFRKLIGTRHPLLKTVKNLFYNGENSVETRGVIILLVSSAANVTASCSFSNAFTDGVSQSQRSLAEIAELIYTANLIHRGILDDEGMPSDRESADRLNSGNKMAVLAGDYLLANASMALAKLKRPNVTDRIAQAIADMTEAEFVLNASRDARSNSPVVLELPAWERFIYLKWGSLLASSCAGGVELAGDVDQVENDDGLPTMIRAAFGFATSLAQLHALTSLKTTGVEVPGLKCDLTPSELSARYCDSAMQSLEVFPESNAIDSLRNIVIALATS